MIREMREKYFSADTKGLTVVIEKSSTVYGGQDITDDVINNMTGK